MSNTRPRLKTVWNTGTVVRIYSEEFGITIDALLAKRPGKTKEDRLCAIPIQPSGVISEMLFYSSVQNDLVEQTWDNLFHYFHQGE